MGQKDAQSILDTLLHLIVASKDRAFLEQIQEELAHLAIFIHDKLLRERI